MTFNLPALGFLVAITSPAPSFAALQADDLSSGPFLPTETIAVVVQQQQRTTDAAPEQDPNDLPAEKFIPAKPLSTAEANAIESQKLYVLGLMHLRDRRLTEALSAFRKAVEKNAEHLPALREIVPLAFRLDRPQEAMKHCLMALKLDPDNPALLRIVALRSLQLGDRQAAIDAFEKACQAPGAKEEDPLGYLQIKLELARLYENKKDAAKTADTLEEIIRLTESIGQSSPQDAVRSGHLRNLSRYREDFIKALIASKRYDRAEEELQKVTQTEAGKRLGIVLAELLCEKGDYAGAMEKLESYRKLQLLDARGPALLQRILDKTNRSAELLSVLEQWVRDDRHNPVLRRVFGEKLLEAKRFDEARAQLSQIQDKPETIPLLLRLFREMDDPEQLLQTLGKSLAGGEAMRSDAANEKLELELQAIAKDRDLLQKVAAVARKPSEKIGIDAFVLNLLMAQIAKSAKDVDLAKEFFDRCIAERDRPEEYEELINILYDAERYSDAEGYCRKAIKRDPNEHVFQDLLVRCLGLQGKNADAIKSAQRFLEASTDENSRIGAYLTLSWAYQNDGNFDKAVETIQNILDQSPDSPRVPYARYVLSNIFTQKGDNLKAEEQLKKLVEGDPDRVSIRMRATANNDLGYMWADRGHNLDEAEKMIRRALEIEPENGAFLDSLGWLLFKRGRYEEAKTYLEKAAAAHEDGADPVIWDHLGDAHLQLGDASSARKAWEKALDLFVKQQKIRDRNGDKARDVKRKIDGLKTPVGDVPKRAGKDDP